MGPMFRDRKDAAKNLTQPLKQFADRNPIILGMARGGAILAAEIARTLDLELDVLVVRKIGAPRNPEYGVGAVAPDGTAVFDNAALQSLGLQQSDLAYAVSQETAEIERRLAFYRHGMLSLVVANRSVILVDDGLATGITALAAARYVKSLGASHVIFAAPVCSKPGARMLEDEVDEIICLESPEVFFAVGMWYEDFTQVTDEEVAISLSPRSRGKDGQPGTRAEVI
jgi:putative phosphoribosyl transferase